MRRIGLMVAAAVLAMAPAAQGGERPVADPQAGRGGDVAELVSAQWRGRIGGAEAVEADRLMSDARTPTAADEVAEASFDLLMIRQDWREAAPARLNAVP